MPSNLLGFVSGGSFLVSGNPWSGTQSLPQGLRLYNSSLSSGFAYVAFSGGLTMGSGGMESSGGLMDGMPIPPNGSYNIPIPAGGVGSIVVNVAAAVSGQVRLFWDRGIPG